MLEVLYKYSSIRLILRASSPVHILSKQTTNITASTEKKYMNHS
jgi:hypothetical protein